MSCWVSTWITDMQGACGNSREMVFFHDGQVQVNMIIFPILKHVAIFTLIVHKYGSLKVVIACLVSTIDVYIKLSLITNGYGPHVVYRNTGLAVMLFAMICSYNLALLQYRQN